MNKLAKENRGSLQLILLLIVSVMVIAVISGCNAGKTQSVSGLNQEQQTNSSKLISKNLQRTSDEGEVAFNITFANPLGQAKDGYLSFIVSLNNHSVDLSSNPLNKSAKLYDGKGNLLAAQSEWETEGDSHHLVGKLNFKTPKDLQNIDGLKLVVENFGGAAKQEFTWEKEYLAF